MKTFLQILFLVAVITCLTFEVKAAGPTVSIGYDSAAIFKGGVRLKSFNNGPGGEIYLGKPDLGIGANRVEIDFYPTGQWQPSNHVKFEYTPTGTNNLKVTVDANNQYILMYNLGDANILNYLQIDVVGRQVGTTVDFNNVTLNSNALGNFSGTGWQTWQVKELDFTSGFTVEGDLLLSGTQPGGETNKLQLSVGYAPPTIVWVSPTYTSGGTNDGHTWRYDAFDNIKEGIDSVVAGGSVYVGDGTYNEDIIIPKSLTLLSVNGQASTIVNGQTTGWGGGALRINSSNVTVGGVGKGFTFSGKSGGTSVISFACYVSGARDSLWIEENKFVAAPRNPGDNETYALLTDGGQTNQTYKNNIFDGMSTPRFLVYVNGFADVGVASTNIDFIGNTFTTLAGGLTLSSSGGEVSGNYFQGTAGIGLNTSSSNTISGNFFQGIGSHLSNHTSSGVDVDAFVGANTFDRKVVIRNGSAYRIETFPWGTFIVVRGNIQGAINAASPGDSIIVAAGSYTEALDINKSVTIVGPNAAISPNTGSRVAEAIIDLSVGDRHINMHVDNVVLKGFEIKNSANAGAIMAGIFSAHSIVSGITIEKNFFHDLSGCAIVYLSYSTSNPTTWIITDNKIQNTTFGTYFGGGYGSGIRMWGGANLTVTNNVLSNIGFTGIDFGWVSNATVSGNTLTNLFDNGMQVVDAASGVIISNNIITNANTAGVAGQGGIKLFGSPNSLTVTGNTVSGSKNGFAVESGNDLTGKLIAVNNNSLAGNSDYGIYHGGIGSLNGTCNWYGTTVPAEVATKISGDVDFLPFLTSASGPCDGMGPVVDITNDPDRSFMTIQAAINAPTTLDGDVIIVAAGTYTENVNVTKRVTLQGAGSGSDPASNTIITNSTNGRVVLLTASGTSAVSPILLQNFRIVPVGINGLEVTNATTVSYIKMENVFVVGPLPRTIENENGFKIATDGNLMHVIMNNCSFQYCDYGWYFAKHGDWGPGGSNVVDVTVTNTTFLNNDYKGIYVEKLSDATFTNVVFSNNGSSSFWNDTWNGGADINLKGEELYQNLVFNNLTVTNNGLTFKEGTGMMIKARGTGADNGGSGAYTLHPATLNNVTINGGTFTGNERGVRFGEPGKGNTTPTNVTIHNATISENNKTYSGTDGSAYGGVVNHTSVITDAMRNWWGHASGPADPKPLPNTPDYNNPTGLGDSATSYVDYKPWYINPSMDSLSTDTIWASKIGNGTITPSGSVSVNYGGNQTFTIAPTLGHHIDSVVVDGVNQGAISSYPFTNVTLNHTIIAYFSIDAFTIDASKIGNGTITPSGSVGVNYGGNQTFTIAPTLGHHIDSVVVDGVNQGAIPSYPFTNVTLNHTIIAYFSINTYTLNVAILGSGTVTKIPDQITYNYGSSVQLTATPLNLSWKFVTWTGDIHSSTNPITIIMDGDKNVTATFNRDSAYLVMYRSFMPESIALDRDNKGVLNRYVKRIPDKVEFSAKFINQTGKKAYFLRINFRVPIYRNDPEFPLIINPSPTTMTIGSTNKQIDLTWADSINNGGIVTISGWGRKGKPQTASYFFRKANSSIDVTLPAEFAMNKLHYPMPNRVNALLETFNGYGINGFIVGKDRKLGLVDSSKYYGWFQTLKYTDVLKTLIVKQNMQMHYQTARGFDKFINERPILRKQKSLLPTRYNNILLADMIALRTNITASDLGVTPRGLGDLIYDDGTSNPLNDNTVREIAAYGDAIMMGQYIKSSSSRVFAPTSVFVNLAQTIQQINRAFEGKLDTTHFVNSLVFTGVKQLIDVSYLRANPSAIPPKIIPMENIVPQIPTAYELYQNYPNPFNPSTTIQFDLPEEAMVTMKIYNLLGQEVATLIDHQVMDYGVQEVEFDASALPSGVYFYRLVATGVGDDEEGIVGQMCTSVKKMLLLK